MSLLLHLVSLLIMLRISYSNHCYKSQLNQCLLSNMSWYETVEKGYRLKIITVATEETEGHLRFMRSAKVFNLDVEVFGLSDEWQKREAEGRGNKLDKLREALLKYKDQKNLILLFTDSYETILTAGKGTILNKFMYSGAKILISADDYCWPDRSLKARYLVRERDGYSYLCSSGIIGYAPSVYKLLSLMLIEPTADHQVGYRHIFLDDRKKYGIQWDRRSELFQNLNGYKEVVVLNLNGTHVTLKNTGYNTVPVVIHGNGPSKVHLTYLGNYVPNAWTENDGCLTCDQGKINLQKIEINQWPKVLIGIYIHKQTPYLDTFLKHITNLDYPKERIDVFIHNTEEDHSVYIEDWMYEVEDSYKSIYLERPSRNLSGQQARNIGIFYCPKVNCDYYLSIDSVVSLTNTRTLQILVEQNRKVLAPMVTNSDKFWKSNFWGDLTLDGKYLRSPDYYNITEGSRRGVWNVPYVRDVYMIKSSVIVKIDEDPFYSEEGFDSFFQFSTHLREKDIFMHVTNMESFGHLKIMKTFTTNHKHADFYQLHDNVLDWEKKYIHPQLLDIKNNLKTFRFEQPCQDVYTFPAVTKAFCDHLIDESEQFKWYRNGRLPGGYENVASSLLQSVGLEDTWRHILQQHIGPVINQLFSGSIPNFAQLVDTAFTVKFWNIGREIPLFNDTSIFTINVALNEAGVEYQGGGETYTRYDCTVRSTKVGWVTVRPGRFTHQFKSISTTKGTRYILVSLIHPP